MSFSWEYIPILLATGIDGGLFQGMLGLDGCFIIVPVTTFVLQDMVSLWTQKSNFLRD